MPVLPKLLIIGAGGFGREVLAWSRQSVQCDREWTIKGFLDDNPDALAGKNAPAAIVSSVQDYQPKPEDVFICAIGTPAHKRRCAELIAGRGGHFTRMFHRTAVVGDNVEFRDGVILCPYTVVSGYNVLGRCVAVNFQSSVDHDATVDDWSQVNSHCDLTAAVRIGREVFVGSSAALIPHVNVGDGAYIGAGAVVTRDVAAGAVVFGVPAREKPRN